MALGIHIGIRIGIGAAGAGVGGVALALAGRSGDHRIVLVLRDNIAAVHIDGAVAVGGEAGIGTLRSIAHGVEALKAAAEDLDEGGAVLIVGINAVQQISAVVEALEGAAIDNQTTLGDGDHGGHRLERAVIDDQLACLCLVRGTQNKQVVGFVEELTALNGQGSVVHNTEGGINAVAVQNPAIQIQSGVLGDHNRNQQHDLVALAGGSQSGLEGLVLLLANLGGIDDLRPLGVQLHAAGDGSLEVVGSGEIGIRIPALQAVVRILHLGSAHAVAAVDGDIISLGAVVGVDGNGIGDALVLGLQLQVLGHRSSQVNLGIARIPADEVVVLLLGSGGNLLSGNDGVMRNPDGHIQRTCVAEVNLHGILDQVPLDTIHHLLEAYHIIGQHLLGNSLVEAAAGDEAGLYGSLDGSSRRIRRTELTAGDVELSTSIGHDGEASLIVTGSQPAAGDIDGTGLSMKNIRIAINHLCILDAQGAGALPVEGRAVAVNVHTVLALGIDGHITAGGKNEGTISIELAGLDIGIAAGDADHILVGVVADIAAGVVQVQLAAVDSEQVMLRNIKLKPFGAGDFQGAVVPNLKHRLAVHALLGSAVHADPEIGAAPGGNQLHLLALVNDNGIGDAVAVEHLNDGVLVVVGIHITNGFLQGHVAGTANSGNSLGLGHDRPGIAAVSVNQQIALGQGVGQLPGIGTAGDDGVLHVLEAIHLQEGTSGDRNILIVAVENAVESTAVDGGSTACNIHIVLIGLEGTAIDQQLIAGNHSGAAVGSSDLTLAHDGQSAVVVDCAMVPGGIAFSDDIKAIQIQYNLHILRNGQVGQSGDIAAQHDLAADIQGILKLLSGVDDAGVAYAAGAGCDALAALTLEFVAQSSDLVAGVGGLATGTGVGGVADRSTGRIGHLIGELVRVISRSADQADLSGGGEQAMVAFGSDSDQPNVLRIDGLELSSLPLGIIFPSTAVDLEVVSAIVAGQNLVTVDDTVIHRVTGQVTQSGDIVRIFQLELDPQILSSGAIPVGMPHGAGIAIQNEVSRTLGAVVLSTAGGGGQVVNRNLAIIRLRLGDSYRNRDQIPMAIPVTICTRIMRAGCIAARRALNAGVFELRTAKAVMPVQVEAGVGNTLNCPAGIIDSGSNCNIFFIVIEFNQITRVLSANVKISAILDTAEGVLTVLLQSDRPANLLGISRQIALSDNLKTLMAVLNIRDSVGHDITCVIIGHNHDRSEIAHSVQAQIRGQIIYRIVPVNRVGRSFFCVRIAHREHTQDHDKRQQKAQKTLEIVFHSFHPFQKLFLAFPAPVPCRDSEAETLLHPLISRRRKRQVRTRTPDFCSPPPARPQERQCRFLQQLPFHHPGQTMVWLLC